jgi:hypothetical protein
MTEILRCDFDDQKRIKTRYQSATLPDVSMSAPRVGHAGGSFPVSPQFLPGADKRE